MTTMIETMVPLKHYVYAMCRDSYEACEHESFHATLAIAKATAETAFRIQESNPHITSAVDASVREWREDLSHPRTWDMPPGTNYRLWSLKTDKTGLRKMYSTDFYIERIEVHGAS